MLDYINKHKGFTILIGLSLRLFIIMLVIFISLFFGSGESKYGKRLEGIEDVELSKYFLQEVEDKLKEDESVVEANVRLQGKIVYILFEVNDDISRDTAKLMASNTLENFSEEELAFYDFSYIIKWTTNVENEEGETEEKIEAIEGTKHPLKDAITRSKS